MKKALLPILVLAALLLPSAAQAADSDLIHVRIQLAMESTHSAVASEGTGVTDHAKRIVVVQNWIANSETWTNRAVVFVRTQDATQLDTCTGDGVSGIPAYECAANGTQAAVDILMSTYLTVLVNAGHGG